jgi:aminobenzoyl-glutamate utilization protein A
VGRPDSSSVLEFMVGRATAILEAAAAMYEVEVSIACVGGARAADSDEELAAVVAEVGSALPAVNSIRPSADFTASDDVSEFMAAVQASGGRAVYFGLGTKLTDLHHTPTFDIDEAVLETGVEVFLGCLRKIGALDDA